MKKCTLISRVAAVLVLTAVGQAATVLAAGQTNVLQDISLQLTYLTQGGYTTNSPKTNDISTSVIKNSYATKDVIQWLGTATTNHFPAKARLLRVKHINADTSYTTIEVRYDRTNIVDVSSLFSDTYSSEKVVASVYNTKTKLSVGKEYEIEHLILTNAAPYNLVPYFRVQGPATLAYVSASIGKTTLSADTITAPDVAGPGTDPNGTPALVIGSVTIIGTQTEVK